MSPVVSIIIVTYNSASHIEACLKSILPQIKTIPAEIIVVDNNSTDETKSVIHHIGNDSPAMQLIENEKNRYFAPAVNQGLKAASGQYLLILNPDTALRPNALAQLLKVFQDDDSVGVIAPQLVYPDGSVQPSCRRFPRHRDVVFNIFGINRLFPMSKFFNGWKMGDFNHTSPREVDQPQGAALLTSRAVLDEVGLLDEDFPMFFNDVDWCYRVKQAEYKILFEPKAQILHWQGASVNRWKAPMVVSSQVSFFRFFEKHYTHLHQQIFNLLAGFLLYITIPFRFIWVLLRSVLSRKNNPALL